MATKRTPGSRPGLIRCDHCGEEYSSSYRRCPFCAEYDADVKDETLRVRAETYGGPKRTASGQRTAPTRTGYSRGGKRVAYGNRRGGGYTKVSAGKILAWLLSLIVIIAAVWIIVTQVVPLINNGEKVDPGAMNTPNSSHSTPVENTPPVSTPTPPPSQDPSVTPSPQIPAGDTAAGFTLNKSEFAFSSAYPEPVTLKVTFSPAGTTATINWSSSDPDIAAVDSNGQVTYGAKRGSATITASMANGVTQTCTVYNQMKTGVAYQPPVENPSTPDPEPSATKSNYKLNKTDFTFYDRGETTKLTVSGYTGTVKWTSSNTNVVTVSSNGTVKAVGTGKKTCTITAILEDGTKLEAIARISIQ